MSIREIVTQMDPPRYTLSQAAVLIGRSEDTLRRWQEKHLRPSDHTKFGSLDVALYTPEDIEKGKRLALTIRPGRKRKGES